MRIVAGPFLSDAEWQALRDAARDQPGLDVRRSVPDLPAELRTAAASVSQCGYNTTLDLLRTGVPALVVPFAEGEEDEQTRRAERLERLRAVRVLPAARADAAALAAEIKSLLAFRPAPVALDLDGARNTALTVANLLARAEAPPPDPARPVLGVAS
jgi:predicted glycosyltransferase